MVGDGIGRRGARASMRYGDGARYTLPISMYDGDRLDIERAGEIDVLG